MNYHLSFVNGEPRGDGFSAERLPEYYSVRVVARHLIHAGAPVSPHISQVNNKI
jgi:hypothetical protein